MKRQVLSTVALVFFLCPLVKTSAVSQDFKVDGKFGLSFFSGSGSSTGVLFGGGLDIPLGDKPNLYARPELNVTTHSSTPIEIGGVVKYNIPMTSMQQTLYVDGGVGFWFMTGGPYFGLDFGGGVIFPLQSSNLQIPAEVRLGPIFSSGSSIFQIAITSGVRFSI